MHRVYILNIDRREHQAADDAQAHKRAVDATEGKMRRRRRERGLDFNSSDSENDGSDNDDPSAKRRREKMRKKRKIDGDTLDDLGEHLVLFLTTIFMFALQRSTSRPANLW